MVDFEKAFFPTEEEKQKQLKLLENIHNERILNYVNQGFSRKEAEEKIEKEIEEYSKRGYYS